MKMSLSSPIVTCMAITVRDAATQIEDEPMWLANREVEVGLRNRVAVA